MFLPLDPRRAVVTGPKAVPSKYGSLASWPPGIFTTGLSWSAVCDWPAAFNELEDALTVKGRPLYRLTVPLIWNPPKIRAAAPWLNSACPLPNGRE